MKVTKQYKILDLADDILAMNRRIELYREANDQFMLNQYIAKKNELLVELSRELMGLGFYSPKLFHFLKMVMSELEKTSRLKTESKAKNELKIDFKKLESIL